MSLKFVALNAILILSLIPQLCFAGRGRVRALALCRAYLESNAVEPRQLAEAGLALEIGKTGIFKFKGIKFTHAHEYQTLKRYMEFRGGLALSTDGFLADAGVPIVDAVYFPPDQTRAINLSLKTVIDTDGDQPWFFRKSLAKARASLERYYSPAALAKLMSEKHMFVVLNGSETGDSPFHRGLSKLLGLAAREGETNRPLELVLDFAGAMSYRAEITLSDSFDEHGNSAFAQDVFIKFEGSKSKLVNLSAESRCLKAEKWLERITLLLGRQVIEIDAAGLRMHDLFSGRILTGE